MTRTVVCLPGGWILSYTTTQRPRTAPINSTDTALTRCAALQTAEAGQTDLPEIELGDKPGACGVCRRERLPQLALSGYDLTDSSGPLHSLLTIH